MKITNAITADDPFGEPWPPGDGFIVVRRPTRRQHPDLCPGSVLEPA
jgi:hypothetical protein